MTAQAGPKTLQVALAVGKVTFSEIVRDKVLYNVFVLAFFLFALVFLGSRLTFLAADRVILDFGMSALTVSCTLIAILSGAGLLGREIERRTIYLALSHPISRFQFLLGKFAGLAGVLAVNWALLSFVFLLLLATQSVSFFSSISFALFAGLFLTLVQSLVVGSLAVFFSSFSTTSLSVIFSIGLYLVGTNITEIRHAALKHPSPMVKSVLNSVAVVLPNFENFNLGSRITYQLPVPPQFFLLGILYGVALTATLLFFAGFLVKSKDI